MATFFRKNIGFITIIVLALLPAIRWIFLPGWNFRFMDLNSTMTSLGQMAGLVGMSLFSLNLILSGRFKFLDRFFYGLNNVYDHHHHIGALALIFLLFHPLFLVIKYLSLSLYSAALFFIPSGNTAVSEGIISLLIMMILLGITFYAKIKYQNWKLSHKFLVLAFVFAVLHVTFITSDISRDNILRFYILGLAYLGLGAGLYRAFLSRYFNRNFLYVVKRVNLLNQGVVAIEMEPQYQAINFKPGQFVFVSFRGQEITSEIHPFSISSAPADKRLQLVVKSLGDYTARLKNLKAGEIASVEGPFGKFSYQNFALKKQIWLAGGVGITPFISMAKSLRNSDYQIDLYYSIKNGAEAISLDDLTAVSQTNKNFKVIPWYTEDKGYISAQKISDLSQGLNGKEIFVCGPPAFMKNLRQQFLQLNVPSQRIHWELFNFL